MNPISPDSNQPDLLMWWRLLRLGGPGGAEPVGAPPPGGTRTPGAPGVPPAPGAPPVPGALVTPGGPVAPVAPGATVLPAVPVDGPRPGDRAVLRDLQRVLRGSLELVASVDVVVARVLDDLEQARPELRGVLPGGPQAQRAQLGAALAWLVDNLDHPQAVAANAAQVGGVLRELNVQLAPPQLLGPALAEAMRASLGANWRPQYEAAWRTTALLAERWMVQGADASAYQPVFWTATVVEHQRRMPDLAVLRLRPYLRYPFRAGQYTTVESPAVPGSWRSYSIAGAPDRENLVELQVRAKSEVGLSGELVYRGAVGDRVRLRPARGAMVLDPDCRRDLLFIAGDTGVAPFKALLGQLAQSGDGRSAVLFWGVRTLDDLYDLAELDALARRCHRATVVPVVSDGDPGPYPGGLVTDAVAAYGQWSRHEVFLAGPPAMVWATREVLLELGVEADCIHHDMPHAGVPGPPA
ncbi:MAG TPA: globin [Catenuloplanes sp.]